MLKLRRGLKVVDIYPITLEVSLLKLRRGLKVKAGAFLEEDPLRA